MKVVAVIEEDEVAEFRGAAVSIAVAARERGLSVAIVGFELADMPLDFFDEHEVAALEFALIDTARLSRKLDKLRGDQIDLAIISTPGQDRSARTAAMNLADLCFFSGVN
jgi:hypothetical protein